MYDVAVIGCGVVGAMIARTLSAYRLKICVLEKESDIAMGSTKANSAIVHAGFDAEPGSLKAKLNVRGSEVMEKVTRELGVSYKRNGSLVIGFDQDDRKTLHELLARGTKNGVKDLRIVEGRELFELEPGLSPKVCCALYAPTGGIICPYELTLAAMGNAMDNGAELKYSFDVCSIERGDDSFSINSPSESIKARFVVNCAGIYADKIAAMAGDTGFSITPRRGEYILLDKECGAAVSHTIFRTPSPMGKGILVSPTVDGNLLTGPTSENISDKDDKSTTTGGLGRVMREAAQNVPSVNFGKAITSFCGLRAVGNKGDFIINSPLPGFVNAAGIESPGLSASPAIAAEVAKLLEETGLELVPDMAYNPHRKPMHWFRNASAEEKNEVIKNNPSYGKIVCRCEVVTEGEIVEAIRTNPRPTDMDGVKRRTRAQMGRCQGGFCSPYIMKLLSRELGIPMESVTKNGGSSTLLTGKIKEAE